MPVVCHHIAFGPCTTARLLLWDMACFGGKSPSIPCRNPQAGLGGMRSAGGCGRQRQLRHKVPPARLCTGRAAAGHCGRDLLRPDGCACKCFSAGPVLPPCLTAPNPAWSHPRRGRRRFATSMAVSLAACHHPTQSCSRHPTSQPVALLAAGFHVVWHFFHLQPSAPLHAMLAAGRDWCDTPWAAVNAGDCD